MSAVAPPAKRAWRALALLAMLALGACGRDPSAVRGSGTIEMDEVDLASLVGGRVARLAFDEGDHVQAGDTVAVLDRGEVIADVETQAAQANRAVSQWRDLEAGPRTPEIGAARAAVAAADADAKLAQSDFERAEKLFTTQLASQAELDRARGARDAASAKLKSAEDQLRLLEAGSRRAQVQAAEQGARAANAQLQAARSRARELVLTAPISGVVLLRNYEPGELVQPNLPIVTLGNPERLWVRVYIATPQMTRVRLGARAHVHVLGSKQAYPGRVIEVSSRAEFTPRAALTEEEQANLVFGVKIALDPSAGALKAGLPAEATIDVPSEASR